MEDIEKVKQPSQRPRSIDPSDLARRLIDVAAEPPEKSQTRWPARDVALGSKYRAISLMPVGHR